MARRAFVTRPFFKYQYGDSGAKDTAMRSRPENTHWKAKGILYDVEPEVVSKPLVIPAARSWPNTQQRLFQVVRMGRSCIDATSEAYAGLMTWKTPQGMPRKRYPAMSEVTFLA
jgi:hypothetical protein